MRKIKARFLRRPADRSGLEWPTANGNGADGHFTRARFWARTQRQCDRKNACLSKPSYTTQDF
jgi:hypothetical protein